MSHTSAPPVADSVAAGPPAAEPETESAGTGLLVSAGLAGLLTLAALLGTWFTRWVKVTDVRNSASTDGIGHFGALSIGAGAGLVLLVGLVGLALWRGGRWRVWPSYAALGVAAVVVVDLVLVMRRISGEQDAAAAAVARLRAAATDGLPTEVSFHVGGSGPFLALTAAFLFALVAALLLWPEHGLLIQASTGLLLGLISGALPWTRYWIIDDRHPDVLFERRTFSLWSMGWQGAALAVEFLLLVAVTYLALRAPGYARGRWALVAVSLTGLLLFGVLAAGIDNQTAAFELRKQVSEVLDSTSTGAGPLLAVGAALLVTVAVRSWWRGRNEVVPDTGGSWLPTGMARRRDR